jgi:hypothetical protein
MKITQIHGSGFLSEVMQARASDPKPKKIKPNRGNESPHPMRNKLVGEETRLVSSKHDLINHVLKQLGDEMYDDDKLLKLVSKLTGHKMNKRGDLGQWMLEPIEEDKKSYKWTCKDCGAEDNKSDLCKSCGSPRRYHVEIDGVDEGKVAAGLAGLGLLAVLGLNFPTAKNTPLGQEIAKHAQEGDAVAAYHLDNLDLYLDAGMSRTLVNLRIAYVEDSPREDVKAFLSDPKRFPQLKQPE